MKPRLFIVEHIDDNEDNEDGSRTMYGTYLDNRDPIVYTVPAGGVVLKAQVDAEYE
jgi:hypothetical protein